MSPGIRSQQSVSSRVLLLCAVAAPTFLTLMPTAAPAGTAWTNVSTASMADTVGGRGLAWADFDGDGDDDLFLTNSSPGGPEADRLFRNDGADAFAEVATGPLADALESNGCAWGDYDEDGDPDLYVSMILQPNRLYRNDGAASFVDVTAGPLGDAGNGQTVAWVDYESDGDLDLYLTHTGSPNANKMLRNDGGTFADAGIAILESTGFDVGQSWGDYDGDGDPDLCFSSRKLLRNDGEGAFVDVTSPPLDGPNGRAVNWVDYDNDNDLDLYVSIRGANPSELLRNDGGSFVSVTAGPLTTPFTQGRDAAWADYDNDGDLDVYIAGNAGANLLVRNDGAGSFVDVTVSPLDLPGPGGGNFAGWSAGWADHDLDGDVDLAVTGFGTSPNVFLFRNNLTNGYHWLHLDLEGVVSNRDGVGARVRVVSTMAGSQIREVRAGSGSLSQSSSTVEFGLFVDAVAESVIVRWPSGIVQVLTGVPASQRMTIVEDDPAVGIAVSSDSSPVFRLHRNYPNPFVGRTVVRYDIPERSFVSLRIYDVVGQLVRTLGSSEGEPGAYRVVWDGRGESGQRVASGIYFSRLQAGEKLATQKIVLLRRP